MEVRKIRVIRSRRKKMSSEDCEALLVAHDIKPTANRIVVAKTLAAAERPMSLSELEYKILSIDTSDGGDGVRYELCHSHDSHAEDDDQHVHFYCERCHRTFCLHDTPIPAVQLPHGYHLASINYMAKGLCPECASH